MKGEKAEIIMLIKKAIAKNDGFIDACGKEENPQVIEMVQISKGRIIAYRDVLDAIEGSDLISLKIAAGS
jgi:hypothetical protein